MAAPMPRVPPVTNATRGMDTSLIGFSETDARCQMPDVRRRTIALSHPSSDIRPLSLHAHRNTHAAANAQRGEPLLGVALLHLVKQRHQNARAGRADRMAERDGAAIDVDLGGVPAEVLVDGAGLGG